MNYWEFMRTEIDTNSKEDKIFKYSFWTGVIVGAALTLFALMLFTK